MTFEGKGADGLVVRKSYSLVDPGSEGFDEHLLNLTIDLRNESAAPIKSEEFYLYAGAAASMRLEQLYPLPSRELVEALKAYPNAELVMVQDEPKNQGAWPFLALNLPEALRERGYDKGVRVASRQASASPATGSSKKHALEEAALMAAAFDR